MPEIVHLFVDVLSGRIPTQAIEDEELWLLDPRVLPHYRVPVLGQAQHAAVEKLFLSAKKQE